MYSLEMANDGSGYVSAAKLHYGDSDLTFGSMIAKSAKTYGTVYLDIPLSGTVVWNVSDPEGTQGANHQAAIEIGSLIPNAERFNGLITIHLHDEGTASVTITPKRSPDQLSYGLIVANDGNEQIVGASIEYGGSLFEYPAILNGKAKAFKTEVDLPLPDQATITWRFESGEDYQKTIPVRELAKRPKRYKGAIWIRVDDAGNARGEMHEWS